MAFPKEDAPRTSKLTATAIAEADSRGCLICNGYGMIAVFAAGYNGNALLRDVNGEGYVARTMAHCQCPLGRLLRSCMPEDVRRRTPDVTEILEGRSTWLLDDPTEEPLDDPSAPVDKAAFRAWWRQIRVSRIAKPIP